ncbi:MAG: hypothetical protein IKY79_04480 [Bacteroidales bacterium]|nr:hypothetical protein [Bacteroidales bacterium]
MKDNRPKILEQVKSKIENSDDNIKHIIEQQSNDYVLFWKKTVRGIGLLSLIVLVVGISQTATMLFVAPTPDALQSSTSLLAAQTTDMPVTDTPILHHHDDKPATITDNEIKNTANQTADRHTHTMLAENSTATLPTADAPQPDAIATTTIEQEHIPMLLAETETQIEIEQNFVAIDTTDTILQLQKDLPKYETNYLAYADTANNNNHIPDISNKTINEELCSLNMITYCNIRCSSNNVTEKIINNLIII